MAIHPFALLFLLFFAHQKEQSRAIFSSLLYKKSNHEHCALLLFAKRATLSYLLFAQRDPERFTLCKKSNHEQCTLLLFTKRATLSDLLFCSLHKE